MEFNIKPEDVLDLAASKLADEYASNADLDDRVNRLIHERVDAACKNGLYVKIDAVLSAELERILGETVTPRTIWGEKAGEPTTIRAALLERAKDFWAQKIDRDGRESSYSGEPRWQALLKSMLSEEFKGAIRANVAELVQAFRAAMLADGQRLVAEHIEKLIPAGRR